MEDIKKKFQLLTLLGRGVYGQVWKVKRLSDDKIYALKLISKSLPKSKLITARKEIEIIKKISIEPNCKKYLVCFIESYEFEDWLGILMEYVKGYSLYKLFKFLKKRKRGLSDKKLQKFMVHILKGLEELHSLGIAHRDIKDDNIIFNRRKLKLVDFGFACFHDEDRVKSKSEICSGMYGTPVFMAPEILSGESELNDSSFYQLSDIWSAGEIFWELASAKEPPSAEDLYPNIKREKTFNPILMEQKLKKKAETQLSRTSSKLRKVILMALNPDVSERPYADELLKMLE